MTSNLSTCHTSTAMHRCVSLHAVTSSCLGSCKMMTYIFLTEELEKHTERINNLELVFFFCGAEDEKRNTTVAVLRGLVH